MGPQRTVEPLQQCLQRKDKRKGEKFTLILPETLFSVRMRRIITLLIFRFCASVQTNRLSLIRSVNIYRNRPLLFDFATPNASLPKNPRQKAIHSNISTKQKLLYTCKQNQNFLISQKIACLNLKGHDTVSEHMVLQPQYW